jgi:cellulose synthase operon protein C
LPRAERGSPRHHLERLLQQNPQSADAARLLARVHLRQGDPDRAETLLRRVLAQNPDDGQALRLMSIVHLERGDTGGAVGHLQRLALLEPGDPATRASIAVLLLRAGEPEQALGELRAASESAPDEVGLRAALVVQLLQGGEYDSALEELKALREAQPGEPLPRTLTAAAYIGKGDPERAREALLEALQVAPGDPAASLTLAQLHLQGGNTDAARGQLRESLRYHPGDPRVSLRLAQLEAEAGDPEAMQAVLEAAVERHPAEVEPRLVLARYHLGRNEPRRSLALLDPVRESAAGNPEILDVLANAQIAAGMRAEAVETAHVLAEHVPDSADTRYRVGMTYERAGSPADARRMYISALELDPNHLAALPSLGAMELREGWPNEAMVLARRMQRIEGIAAAGYVLEGRVHSTAGRNEDALAAFQQAHARSPSPETAVALGLTLQQADRARDAAEMLRATLDQYPDETAVRLTLAQALLSLGENAAAIREYQDLVRTLPEHVAVLNNLAYLYHVEGDGRALEYAERAHAQAPNNPAVADTLGWILVERGDVVRGLPLLATAREALPEVPDVRYHYAVALAKAGRKAAAQQELKALLEAFESFPQREDAQRLMSQLR